YLIRPGLLPLTPAMKPIRRGTGFNILDPKSLRPVHFVNSKRKSGKHFLDWRANADARLSKGGPPSRTWSPRGIQGCHMEALFIGQTYIDVTFVADHIPTGDDKDVARDYAVSFGGNAVTAAFCCARLGIPPDLLTSIADDWLGRMFLDMAAKYQVCVHPRKVRRSSLSFVMPKGGKRAIVRCRDDEYLHPPPPLNLRGCRALHLDGH